MTITDRIEWTNPDLIDKSTWGPGAWQTEPDKVQWTDPGTDLPCLLNRNRGGAWCGYVGVDESHPMFGRDYDAPDVDVHGGLTFADKCHPSEQGERDGICHVPAPGKPDLVWWFGFDCAHYLDIAPGHDAVSAKYGVNTWRSDQTYKDIEYASREVTALAAQLAANTGHM